MNELPEVNVQEIMAEIRENLRRKREGVPPGPSSDGQNNPDLDLLHSDYDITRITFTSHRKTLGPLVVLAKKALRQLLTPILARQVGYNAANTRLTTLLKDQVATLGSQQAELRGERDRFRDELARLRGEAASAGDLARLRDDLARLRGEAASAADLARLRGEAASAADLARLHEGLAPLREETASLVLRQDQVFQALRERISRAERKLRRILYMNESQEAKGSALAEPAGAPRQELEADFDYAGMEERFRGSEEEIKERQRKYLEHFKGAQQVLDVGCGRGEFLELLREAGITARGVDTNLDMVLLCKEKGLDVIEADTFVYLQELPDESLDGISAAMFIEHLPPSEIVGFIHLCRAKLRPNGVILLETPNPKCLTTMAWGFYLDFSHVWPCHPEAMRYVLETAGFRDIRLEFSGPVDPTARIPFLHDSSLFGEETGRFNRAAQLLNELLFSHQDYAIIGRRT